MSEKTKRKVTVNGNRYHIVGEESDKYNRVSVYDNSLRDHYPNKNDLVYRKKYKYRLWGLLTYDVPPIEEMMEDAFNEAVCILEEKQEEQEEFEQRLEDRLDNVKEIHEE